MTEEKRFFSHTKDETHLLREIMRVHQALTNAFSREVGMPAARLALMRVLALAHPEEIGIMEIARRLGVNAAAVTRQVKDMEADGTVVRPANDRDGRYRFVMLTPRGLETFKQIHERAHEFEQSLSSTIEDHELATATDVLTRVRTAIEGMR